MPGGFSVFAGVGERTREGNDLYREMIESGESAFTLETQAGLLPTLLQPQDCPGYGTVVRVAAVKHLPLLCCSVSIGKLAAQLLASSAPAHHRPCPHSCCLAPGVIKLGAERGNSKCTLVYGQMNEPPGARARVALTGLTVAEYFRDVEGQDVLLFVDNIFRFTQANSEVSALLGRIPSAVGYQPTLATDLGGLQERITTTTKGSITSVQVRGDTRVAVNRAAGAMLCTQQAGAMQTAASHPRPPTLSPSHLRPVPPRLCTCPPMI